MNSVLHLKRPKLAWTGTLRLRLTFLVSGSLNLHVAPVGDSHIKVVGMLFVSLWGVNFRFWSHLGCLGWKVTIFAHSGIV